MKIAAGKFKAICLRLLDEVKKNHMEVVITKRGKPVAKLVPAEEEAPRPLFGYMKGSIEITGNIVAPTGEKWEAEN